MPLESIGRYKLIRELGRGAMGVVYAASDPNLGRTVALKSIHANAIGTNPEEAAQRFKNEARAAGALSHPNIVTVFDAGEQDGLLYIAMELLEGETLEAHLGLRRTVAVERAIDITRQICAALDYANSKGIVHRDIKPGNVILLPNGTAKITDFGLARTAEAITMTGQVMGTPHYMSPEQVRGRPADGRSDLFSVGVMLYEMLTGERPFEGQSITTIMYKIVHENPTPARALDSSIAPGLSAVIERAMAKSPDDRFQTGAAFSYALENYRSFQPAVASTAATINVPPAATIPSLEVPHSPSTGATNRVRPRRRKFWIGAACILVLAGVFTTMLRHGKTDHPETGSQPEQAQAPAPPPAPSAQNETQSAAVIPSKNMAVMSVKSIPPTASIFVDDKPTGLRTPAQLQLSPGEHKVSVEMEGFQRSTTKVRVKGGEQLDFSPQLEVQLPNVPGVNMPGIKIPAVDLKKLEELQKEGLRSADFWQQWTNAATANVKGGAPPDQLSILVNTHPKGARVWVDGNDTGKDSPAIIPEKPGSYKVRVELDGYEPAERDVKVEAGRPAMVKISLKVKGDAQ